MFERSIDAGVIMHVHELKRGGEISRTGVVAGVSRRRLERALEVPSLRMEHHHRPHRNSLLRLKYISVKSRAAGSTTYA